VHVGWSDSDVCITGNGSVSRGEWIECFVNQFGASSDQAMAAFRHLDSSGSGELSMDKLKRIFSTMDTDGKSNLSKSIFPH